MTPQTPEKEIPAKGYAATQPVVLDAANVDDARKLINAMAISSPVAFFLPKRLRISMHSSIKCTLTEEFRGFMNLVSLRLRRENLILIRKTH